jgi:hypothetical protein
MVKRALVAMCAISALLAATRGSAQEPPPAPSPPPPPTMPPPGPPPGYYFQPPPGYFLVPMPTPDEVDALEHAGRTKRRAGIILIASGSGLLVVGTALWIAGAATHDDNCLHSIAYRYGDDSCENGALIGAGAGTALLGSAAVLVGVPVYVMGNSQLHRALRLRRGMVLAPSIKAAPSGAAGGLATVSLHY